MIIEDVVKVLVPSTVAFLFGIGLTVFLSHYLYKYEMWKKRAGKKTMGGEDTPIFNSLHKDKEVGTPKMGGIVVWGSAILTIASVFIASQFFPGELTGKLVFLSRSQTWIPFVMLLIGGFVGLIDDYFEVREVSDHIAGGLSLWKRLMVVTVASFVVAMWFYTKLEVASIGIPFVGDLFIGPLFIPLFICVALLIYSGGVIDGIDGLAGGIFAAIFGAYGGIAFYHNQINLAAFCAMIVGGILAFLWFNIPPARFYLSETGTMALTLCLTSVAFMTDSVAEGHGVFALPIIAFPLIVTTFSDIIQILSRKFRGKKVFLVAPLHHHFEALGWPSYKVTMRYWVIGVVFAVAGFIIGVIG